MFALSRWRHRRIAPASLLCCSAESQEVRPRLVSTLLGLILASAVAAQDRYNGFDVSKLEIPLGEIHQGGPPRDGIPALTDPDFLTVADAKAMKPEERVLGVMHRGVAKAYPLSIMNWHEIVNDRFGEVPVVVTYCPLCFTGMAFHAEFDGQRQAFGVSGLLYNSDVLLYDRQTASLWSQILRKAVSGPRRGQVLVDIPVVNTTWNAWRARHPDTMVLARPVRSGRDYDRNPYAGYDQRSDLFFPVRFRAQGYHPKEKVLGIVVDGVAKAYPVSELSRGIPQPMNDTVGRTLVRVRYDADAASAEIERPDGSPLPGVMGYWFAWYAFHPDTAVFHAGDPREKSHDTSDPQPTESAVTLDQGTRRGSATVRQAQPPHQQNGSPDAALLPAPP